MRSPSAWDGPGRSVASRAARLGALLALAALVVVAHTLLLSGLASPDRERARPAVAVQLAPPRVTPPNVTPNTESPRVVDAAPPAAAATAPDEAAHMSEPRPRAAPRLAAARPPAQRTASPAQRAASPAAARVEAEPPLGDPDPNGRPAPAPLPTRVPPSAELHFSLQRGDASGVAHLSWRVDGERYALGLRASMPRGREVEQHSQGGFDAVGLAPQRLADRRHGRDVRAVNFQREHGKITFSGPNWELPLQAGTQDRLSWLVQLVAIAGAASPDGLPAGQQLSLPVVGARGALSDWRFEVRGIQRVAGPQGEADVLWLVREPVHPYDLRVEVWLDPARGHWPLRLRQTTVPGGEPLEWTLLDGPTAPAPGT